MQINENNHFLLFPIPPPSTSKLACNVFNCRKNLLPYGPQRASFPAGYLLFWITPRYIWIFIAGRSLCVPTHSTDSCDIPGHVSWCFPPLVFIRQIGVICRVVGFPVLRVFSRCHWIRECLRSSSWSLFAFEQLSQWAWFWNGKLINKAQRKKQTSHECTILWELLGLRRAWRWFWS